MTDASPGTAFHKIFGEALGFTSPGSRRRTKKDDPNKRLHALTPEGTHLDDESQAWLQRHQEKAQSRLERKVAARLAKAPASELQASKDTLAFLASAEAAAGHAAALLGVVTHAANNFTEVETHEDGTTSKRILRDSVDKPKAKRARAEVVSRPHSAAAAMPSLTSTHVSVAPWRPPSATTLAKKRRVETEAGALAASIERIGSGMTGRSHGLTGKRRLHALASRLAGRQQL